MLLIYLICSDFHGLQVLMFAFCLNCSPESTLMLRDFYVSIRQEAAGALWNLSFDDRNREAIAAVGGVEALVSHFPPHPPHLMPSGDY